MFDLDLVSISCTNVVNLALSPGRIVAESPINWLVTREIILDRAKALFLSSKDAFSGEETT